jgi:hypothetical protein
MRYKRLQSPALFLFSWLDLEAAALHCYFKQNAFDCTRHKHAKQCRNLVQSCGFVWKKRKKRCTAT